MYLERKETRQIGDVRQKTQICLGNKLFSQRTKGTCSFNEHFFGFLAQQLLVSVLHLTMSIVSTKATNTIHQWALKQSLFNEIQNKFLFIGDLINWRMNYWKSNNSLCNGSAIPCRKLTIFRQS